MNLDDPKLTAYALDELDETEQRVIAHEVNASPDARREVQELQTFARLLRAAFAAELERPTDTPSTPLSANLSDIRDDPWFWTRARPLAIAAVLAIFAVIGLAIFGGYQLRQREIAQAGRPASALPSTSSAVDAEVEDAESTASSYAVVRQSLNERVLPSKDSVRIEEIINYFPYDYPEPTRDELLSLNVEIATCPWADAHRLVRIGLKARKKAISQADTADVPPRPIQIAREVKIGVKFSPAEVGSYQLIGYEKQAADKQNPNRNEIDVGDMAAGHAVTVLFEVVPPANPAANVRGADSSNPRSNEVLTVNLRYKRTESDKSEVVERGIVDGGKQFANASPDFKFAAAVAEFGMLLRDSEFKGSFGAVMEWAEEGKGLDSNGYRAEFLELVRKAEALRKG